MSRGSRARCLGLSLGTAALALACASPAPQAPGDDVAYEVVHEAFGLRADLDGWQVYQDAEAAPAVLQRLFASKRGPDDPPLFVALRDQVVLTGLVQLDFPADSRAMYEHFAAGIGRQGEVMHAVQLPESGDILWSHRIGQGASTAYSRALLHVADGRMVHVMLTQTGAIPAEQTFVDALGAIELRGAEGWQTPWDLSVPVRGELLAGDEGGPSAEEFVFAGVECPAGEHPLLWSVSGAGGGRMHLFGSLHVGHATFYPFAAPIEQAFEGSDRLVVEVDNRVSEDEVAEALAAGALPDGQKLSDVVSPELYARVQQATGQLGMPPGLFDEMTPGRAGLTLSVLPLFARGFDPQAGVDLYFLTRAQGKQVLELETLEDQLAMVDSVGVVFLESTLDGLETLDADLDLLHRAWRCGDEEALGRSVFDLPRERAETSEDLAQVGRFNETFLYQRNREMARRLGALLDAGGDSFVVVGAAHLVREQGVPALLRAAGYRVERVGR